MTDIEILKWLYDLKPESNFQRKKLERMMAIIIQKEVKYEPIIEPNIEEFLNTLTPDDVLNKTSKEVYIRYSNWCKKQGDTPIAHNIFTHIIQNEFNVKSTVAKVNGKSTRIFRRVSL